jgi:hypothetical protein
MKKARILFPFLLLLTFFGYRSLERSYFDFSQIQTERKPIRILALHRNGTGEKEAIVRMEQACRNLGWELYSCSSNPSFWKRHFLFNPLQRVIQAVEPDFTLNFQCKEKFAPGINFVSMASGVHLYFDEQDQVDLNKLAVFDGFLPTFQDIGVLQRKIESVGAPFHGMIWLFTCPHRHYTHVEPRSLFYCGSNWDKTRKGLAYRKLFKLLDNRQDVAIYGPKKAWNFLSHVYRGSLPFDGNSLIKAMQSAGIVLILHSESHIKGNSPTARIFEAAAASCVVISDLHPFVVKEFGDSVLYIDQTKEPEEILKQIEGHLNWVYENREEAIEMAKRAHRIFEERFTLEAQFQKLSNLFAEVSTKLPTNI